MTTGAGIAMLAVWGFVAACAISKRVTGCGFILAIIVGMIVSGWLIVR